MLCSTFVRSCRRYEVQNTEGTTFLLSSGGSRRRLGQVETDLSVGEKMKVSLVLLKRNRWNEKYSSAAQKKVVGSTEGERITTVLARLPQQIKLSDFICPGSHLNSFFATTDLCSARPVFHDEGHSDDSLRLRIFIQPGLCSMMKVILTCPSNQKYLAKSLCLVLLFW